jgi:ABC-type bacteriocin/lantibiotic exporter with double-glycine peptidase domain
MLKKILFLLTTKERKQAGMLMFMMLTMAILDMLGVASILPFIAVLANPDQLHSNALLSLVFTYSKQFGIDTPSEFMFVLGVLVFLLLIISLSFKALTFYFQIRFALMREYSISKRLVEGYLNQPYSWFLERHSADLGKTILSEVGTIVSNVMVPVMTLMAQSLVALALLVLLLVVDVMLAVSVGAGLVVSYLIIFYAMRGWLKRLGNARNEANQKRFTTISEAFGGVKEVKVGGKEQIFIDRFSRPAEIFANSQATARVISEIPRMALEAIAFGGMLLVILYLMATNGSFSEALPIIALYAFTGYRLMPALQQIYGAFSQLSFSSSVLDALHADLANLQKVVKQPSEQGRLSINKFIELEQVSYTYTDMSRPALQSVSLKIQANSTVGIVGVSGSGKSTVIDIILGLLEPSKGRLIVDGVSISVTNRRHWQSFVGYVPQQIYLTDDTVIANIAFGVDPKEIDFRAVVRAAKIANLHEFVINQMGDGYSTIVGERGVRLSGGQRQRIGIARALYNNPKVLILDEATSALDNLTEKAVMEAVDNLDNETTVILIAHRLSTVRNCDQIFLLEHGVLQANGTFDELARNNHQFALMASEKR